MRALIRDNLFEALVGLLVVILAIWFILFAWGRTGGGVDDAFEVKALFPAANGVSPGTDVRIAGMKVGTVRSQALDQQSYQAEVTMALDGRVTIPSDSTAAITSEGLLGGTYIALLPGGSATPLKAGDLILDTQGSIDMMSIIGSMVNRTGGAPAPASGGGLGTMDEDPSAMDETGGGLGTMDESGGL